MLKRILTPRGVQERQRQRQAIRVGAFEAGATDHHVEPVAADIGPDAVPQ